ncbi:hypothetical protein [Mesorhizobium sp. M4B.F.Ca.ET.169.01.1.1]|uniref:hypothetical protein n=1 Tax=Mesorhizobium sp. M4B.F.Ca.ET.169.01.1.1 TaxID=2563949 RepID=UPI00167B3565|nr:hypothetical protein [Mesorhizobium sp. M4B.F.Ca.ET.169.01.1.1]
MATNSYVSNHSSAWKTSIAIAKTLRDAEETGRFINRLQGAKTEKLMMDINRSNEV